MSRMQRLVPVAKVIGRDLIGLAGLGLMVAGIGEFSPALAMIAAGAVGVAAAAVGAMRSK